MRILHLIVSLDPRGGGPPAVAARLAAAQAHLGHDVGILCYSAWRRGESFEQARQAVARVPGMTRVTVHALPPASWLDRLLGRGVPAALDRLSPGPDIIHMHGVWAPMGVRAAGWARRHGVPYVVCSHGMLDRWPMRQRAFKKRLALALGCRRMLDGARFLHAIRQTEARAIADLGLRAPVRVIPNAVALEELTPLPPPGSFHAAHPELGGERYVLFLGRLHYVKGLDILGEAFARLSERLGGVRLVVAGPDEGALEPFRRQVAALKIGGRVHVVGPLFGQDKLAALADAACLCLPSRYEVFGIVVAEALACGVPVVVSRECHFAEVSEVGAGIETDLDPADIAEALMRVLADADLRRRMAEAGRTLVRERFTWPVVARQVLEAYGAE